MSVNSVIPPYPIFSDQDGTPLENGYIYIGEPNLNPETNPKNAYWDKSLTIPVSQPVRTTGGYPSRSGTPSVIYVDGEYSITTRDINGVLVYTSGQSTLLININYFSNEFVSDVDNYTALQAIDIDFVDSVNIKELHTDISDSGGIFNYDPTINKSTANSGTIIDTSVTISSQGTGIGLGCWVRQYNGPVNVKWFGAVGDGVTDDTASIQAAINSTLLNNSVYIPVGRYVVTGTITIADGVPIYGEHQGSTEQYGTTIIHNSNLDLFHYSGTGTDFANTGGGISKMLILKGTGYSGGHAILCDGTLINKRASTFAFHELTIFGTGTGIWSRAISLDGSAFGVAGSRGLRNFSLYKVRVADCSANNEYVKFNQVTHLSVDMLQIDTGSGTGTTGMTITGYSENVNMVNVVINGNLYIPVTATLVTGLIAIGRITTLINDHASTSGAIAASQVSVSSNVSTSLTIVSNSSITSRAIIGSSDGYTTNLIQLFKSSSELLRVGTISDAIQSVIPQKNDGQLWIYGNAFDYETSGTQTAYKFEYSRFRPSNDNIADLGNAANRWAVVYAGTGTINTSDDREKTYLDINDAERSVAIELKSNMKKFKFNDAIKEKGIDKARIHFGASAQTVKSIFEKHGLRAEDYALLCYDEWDAEEEVVDEYGKVIQEAIPAGDRYGLRYEELLSFIVSSI